MIFNQYTVARANTGAVLPFAVVSVYLADGVTLATIYNSGGSAIGNPITADINGSVGFEAADGTYVLSAVSADTTYSMPHVTVQIYDLAFVALVALTVDMLASENIAAGKFVNIYNASGTMKARLADNTDAAKFANGLSLNAITSGAIGRIATGGRNTAVSPSTTGEVWLGTSGGFITTRLDPTDAGNTGKTDQCIGTALPGFGIDFSVQSRSVL